METRVKADADDTKYPFVVFSAPPSGSEDYPTEVRHFLSSWSLLMMQVHVFAMSCDEKQLQVSCLVPTPSAHAVCSLKAEQA